MNRSFSIFGAGLLTLPLLGCNDDARTSVATFDDPQVIVDFADQVVVPTYELLAARGAAVLAACDALAAAPDAERLEAARAAWVAARSPWEQSEGFLFGPVDSLGIDPALDTWPLNETDLQAVLASNDGLTESYVANLPSSQKGFHALEYLLFGIDGARVVADLDARELEYLVGTARDFATQTARLARSWIEGAAGIAAYRDLFATAGQAGNAAYPSLTAAAQEIVSGMAGICDEVANGKIADPFDNQDPLLEESQFSHNSLDDFQDNLRSVQNAYLGAVPSAGTSGRGLTVWVAAEDAALDQRIRAEITAAIAAIAAIPAPFSEAVLDDAAAPKIIAAQEAIRTLQATLEGDLTDLVLGQ